MNKQEYEKLLEAFWMVKEYCKSTKCKDCIAYTGIQCDDVPSFWILPKRKNHE